MQDSLHKKYDGFPGGYFDKGGVHWLLRDGLGSVGMTVDDSGKVEQHVQYYPYGEPHREPQGQPYLYGGKERRRFGGLNDYDFHARFLNPAAALWHAPDRDAANYPNFSPYVFCLSNPVRYGGYNGNNVVVLNAGNGHLAMLVQNEEGKYAYYSFNGDKFYNLTGGEVGGNGFHNLGEKIFDSAEQFMSSSYNSEGDKNQRAADEVSGYEFTDYFEIETSSEEDAAVSGAFRQSASEKYDLISHNCVDAVLDGLTPIGRGNVSSKKEGLAMLGILSLASGKSLKIGAVIAYTAHIAKELSEGKSLISVLKTDNEYVNRVTFSIPGVIYNKIKNENR